MSQSSRRVAHATVLRINPWNNENKTAVNINETVGLLSPPDQQFMHNQRFLHAKRPEFWMIVVIVASMLVTGSLAFVDDYKWVRHSDVFMSRSDWIILTSVFLGSSIIFMGLFYYIRHERSEVMGSMAWDHWALYNVSIWTIIGYFALLMFTSLAPASSDCEPPAPDGSIRCRPWRLVVGLAIGLVLFAINIMAFIVFQEQYLRYIHVRGHAMLDDNPQLDNAARILRQMQDDPDEEIHDAIYNRGYGSQVHQYPRRRRIRRRRRPRSDGGIEYTGTDF